MCRCGFCFKYGEVFIDERNGTWNTPYLFNGKFINALTTQTTHIPNLHSTLHTAPWKAKPHQSLAPPSALIPTTKLAPTGQKHFIDFGSCRWGESNSPCFIFSRNFPDVASGLSSLFPRDFVPGYHRYAQYCLPGRFPWCYLSPVAVSWAVNAISPRLRPRLPSLRSVLPSRQGEMLGSCLLETWN